MAEIIDLFKDHPPENTKVVSDSLTIYSVPKNNPYFKNKAGLVQIVTLDNDYLKSIGYDNT